MRIICPLTLSVAPVAIFSLISGATLLISILLKPECYVSFAFNNKSKFGTEKKLRLIEKKCVTFTFPYIKIYEFRNSDGKRYRSRIVDGCEENSQKFCGGQNANKEKKKKYKIKEE